MQAGIGYPPFKVLAVWDDDAQVFIATSDDIPGLVTEAENLGVLERKLKIMIPELLELNHIPVSGREIRFVVHANIEASVPLRA